MMNNLQDRSTQDIADSVIRASRIIGLAKADYEGEHNNAAQWCFIRQMEDELQALTNELDRREESEA